MPGIKTFFSDRLCSRQVDLPQVETKQIKTNTKFLFKLLALQKDHEISDGLSPIFPYWLGIASSCSG